MMNEHGTKAGHSTNKRHSYRSGTRSPEGAEIMHHIYAKLRLWIYKESQCNKCNYFVTHTSVHYYDITATGVNLFRYLGSSTFLLLFHLLF